MMWLTTNEAAKQLGLTRWGVHWLVRQGQLACARTPFARQCSFDPEDVERLRLARVAARFQPRSKRRAEILKEVHARMVKVGLEPVQLSLFRRVRATATTPDEAKGHSPIVERKVG